MHDIGRARDSEWLVLERCASGSAAQIGSENFPVALRLLPRRARDQLAAVYTYARFVDDVGDAGDEAAIDGDAAVARLALLDLIDADVLALRDGRSVLTAVAALAPIVSSGMPLAPFRDLIDANRVDQHVNRYETFDDLLGYCRLSAAPVGRIVLHIAGAATERNVADSDAVCAALQILEHCQDVGEDARSGRIYLPGSDLRSTGVTDDELLAFVTSRALRQAVALNVGRAADLLHAGRPLVRRLSGWARLAVAGYVAGGVATAAALRKHDFDVLARDIKPSRLGTLGVMARRWTGV